MATTLCTLMTAEPDNAYTLGGVHALVRSQGRSYLDCNPYQVDADAAFWELMDRFMMAEKVTRPKSGKEKAQRNTPTRLSSGCPKAKSEKKYPNAIPIKGKRRRRHELDSSDDDEESRTERFQRRESAKNDKRTNFPNVLHEDQLLDLSSELTYRINCIKQATQYARVLGVTMEACNELDLDKWLAEELYQTGPEFAMRRIGFDWVQSLVEQAELFEMPRRRKEEKAIKYITIAVIMKEGWSEAYSLVSQGIANDFKTLAARRQMILRPNVYEPVNLRGYQLPREEDEVHGTKPSPSTAKNRNNTRAVTPPIVVRGGFGK